MDSTDPAQIAADAFIKVIHEVSQALVAVLIG